MKWIDISLTLSENLPSWPGQKSFVRKITAKIGENSDCNLSRFCSSTHFGTHVDVPYHFIENGKKLDEMPLEHFVGKCQVIELQHTENLIEIKDLENKIEDNITRLLVKTDNSRIINDSKFHEEFTAFSAASCRWLVNKGVNLLGIDYFSIGPFDEGKETHKAFLENNKTVAVEGLNLRQVNPGFYQLVCLPLKIKGSDGAPARVILGVED